MARPVYYSLVLALASASNICASQSAAGAGALTLNGSAVSGGVATLDVARRVIVTSAGNDSGITFAIVGTNQTGNAISQTITGSNAGVAATTLDFLTISSVTVNGATASTVTVGTNTVGSTPWIQVNPHARPVSVSLAAIPSGTVTYNAEYTFDDIQNTTSPPTPWPVTGMTNVANSNSTAVLNDPVTGVRLTVLAGVAAVTFQVVQAGIKA